jgi:hypothetical protein
MLVREKLRMDIFINMLISLARHHGLMLNQQGPVTV